MPSPCQISLQRAVSLVLRLFFGLLPWGLLASSSPLALAHDSPTHCDEGPCDEECLQRVCNPDCIGVFQGCQGSCCPCNPDCGGRLADVSVSPDLTWIGDVVTGTVCSDGAIYPTCYELVVSGAEFTTGDFACPLTYPLPAERPAVDVLLTPEPNGWCLLAPPADEEMVYLPGSYTFYLFTDMVGGGSINIGEQFGPPYGSRSFLALSLDLALGQTGFPELTPLEHQEPGHYFGVNDDFDERKPTEDWEDVSPIWVPPPNEVAKAKTDDMVPLYLDLMGWDPVTCGGSGRVSVKLSADPADNVRVLAINPACLTQANCGGDPLCPNCYKVIPSGYDVAPDYLFGSKSNWEFYLEGLSPGTVRLKAEGMIDGDSGRRRNDEILFKVVKIDADVDSDNTNNTAPYGPDATDLTEDRIEQRAGEPGRLVLVNDDDDDQDGLQDYDPDDLPVAGGDNDLVAITFSAPDFTPRDPNYAKWVVSLSSAAIDIWQNPNKTGFHIPAAGTADIKWTDFALPQTWYIQGLQVTPAGPVQITANLLVDPDGSETAHDFEAVHHDTVQVTVLGVDIDVDSDNDEGNAVPLRTAHEDQIEDDPDLPGKVIIVNDNDNDRDNVVDYGDGFNLDQTPENSDDATQGENDFIPLAFEIPSPIDASVATIRVQYDASDPGLVPFSVRDFRIRK